MHSYAVGLHMKDLDTPALLLDAAALERNVAHMAGYLASRPCGLRPHSKTHKCPAIAWMQLKAGAVGITCAKLGEAEVMAQASIEDLLIANQVVGVRKITRLVHLAQYTRVTVAVEDEANATELSAAAGAAGTTLRVILEVDVGMKRCGVAPGEASLALARRVVSLPNLQFDGIMGYEGHCVMIADMDERRRAAEQAMALLVGTKDLLVEKGIPVAIVSGGGTGTYQITGNYAGVTDIQAGSYATMDTKYASVPGVDFEYALHIIARVISTTGDRAIVDAGMKTMTHEFGLPVVANPEGWALAKLSEEHGILARQGGPPLKPGDTVELIPSHGCTTINLHDAYHVTRDGVVEAVWPVAARGRID